jgi:hypothetical protein
MNPFLLAGMGFFVTILGRSESIMLLPVFAVFLEES